MGRRKPKKIKKWFLDPDPIVGVWGPMTPEEAMAYNKKGSKYSKKPTPIFQWTFKGTEVSGTVPVYTTQLRSDGTLSCNCPGWVFHRKKDQPRVCKHTRKASEESGAIYNKWQHGESLPMIMSDPLASAVFTSGGSSQPTTDFGRVIELD